MHLGSSTGYRKLDVECCSLCDVAALMSLETLNRIFASNSWLLLHDQASSQCASITWKFLLAPRHVAWQQNCFSNRFPCSLKSSIFVKSQLQECETVSYAAIIAIGLHW